jgi:hypothetical protein
MGLKALLDSKAILQQEVTNRRAELELALAPILAQVEATDKEIYDLLAPDLVAIRKLQQKEFGAVHVTKDGYRVVETIQKKVRWDQEKLFGVFHVIQSTGDNPFDWMKAEFKVGEKEYGAYPKNIQAVFAPARTVTPGDPKLGFKPVEAPDA